MSKKASSKDIDIVGKILNDALSESFKYLTSKDIEKISALSMITRLMSGTLSITCEQLNRLLNEK